MDVRSHFLPDRHEQLNETATIILELCDGQHSLIDIWRVVMNVFQTPTPEVALHDCVRTIRYFQRFYLVYTSTVPGEQHIDVRHPRNIPSSEPVAF
jgi:hypothetical protein